MQDAVDRSYLHKQIYDRRSIGLDRFDDSQPGAYFVTIATFDHLALFGDVVNGEMRLNDCGRIVDACWRAIPEHFPNVELGVYVVMPDHLHGIVVIMNRNTAENLWIQNRTDCDQPPPVRAGAVGATHASPLPQESPGTDPGFPCGPAPGSLSAIIGSFKSAASKRIHEEQGLEGIWQRNYYDHIIRDGVDLDRAWNYIRSNPSRWREDK